MIEDGCPVNERVIEAICQCETLSLYATRYCQKKFQADCHGYENRKSGVCGVAAANVPLRQVGQKQADNHGKRNWKYGVAEVATAARKSRCV